MNKLISMKLFKTSKFLNKIEFTNRRLSLKFGGDVL